MRQPLYSLLWDECVVKSWWIWLTLIVCFGMYEQGAYRLNRKILDLETEITQVKTKLALSCELQQELKQQVASFNDSAWIELVLIRALGLVPEGYQKVYFQKKEPIAKLENSGVLRQFFFTVLEKCAITVGHRKYMFTGVSRPQIRF